MENQQFKQPGRPDTSHTVPLGVEVQTPQVPPQYVTIQRRMYVAPSITKTSLPDQLPQTPMQGHQLPTGIQLSQTPMPIANGFTAGANNIALPAQPQRFPSRPLVSIGGSRATQKSLPEYGVGETLMGCGVLIAIGITILVVLYYISM